LEGAKGREKTCQITSFLPHAGGDYLMPIGSSVDEFSDTTDTDLEDSGLGIGVADCAQDDADRRWKFATCSRSCRR
jgi:hypothetical protein